MRIKKIYFKEHKIFGEIEFDFTDKDGNSLDTIIFAGENGCGKTVLLDTIFDLTNNLFHGNNQFGKIYNIYIEASDEESKLITEKPINRHSGHDILLLEDSDFKQFIFKFNFYDTSNPIKLFLIRKDGSHVIYQIGNFYDSIFDSFKKCIYSTVEINFVSNTIDKITTKSLDLIRLSAVKTPINLATEITQLLIDIRAQDSEDFMHMAEKNKEMSIPMNITETRMRRFNDAFKYMFEGKSFKGIETRENKKIIMFEENGIETTINQLSSGEKQIVFRGSFLLKDKFSNNEALILIDEPELSMHPRWQMKILEFYKKLFIDAEGIQISQIFIATHSPFIIHNSNRYNDKVIVLNKDKSGKIAIKKDSRFYSWGKEEAIEEAFKIDLFQNTNTPIVFLEGETDEKYINKTIDIYKLDTKGVSFQWIGHYKNNQATYTGNSSLNNTKSFLEANSLFVKNKVILLYDCDVNKEDYSSEKIFVRSFKKINDDRIYKKGIENQLNLPIDFKYNKFYTKRREIDDYGSKKDNEIFEKMNLCSYICSLNNEELKPILLNIRNKVEEIIKLVNL